MARVRYLVLGQLTVVVDGHPLPLGGRRQQLVLAVLLDSVNQRVSTARLADDVWGTAPPPSWRKTLQAYVSRLRRLLPPDAIASLADGYRLVASEEDVDATLFERHAAAAIDSPSERPDEPARLLRSALELWRGTPWGSLGDEPALAASRARLLERRLEVIEHRIDADLALGRDAGLTSELVALVADHPLRENLHGLLMVALYRQGQHTRALDVADDLRQQLQEELGVEPSPRIDRLRMRVIRHDPLLMNGRTDLVASVPADPPSSGLRSGHGGGEGRHGPPGRGSGLSDHTAGDAPNPYRGLRAFGDRDADVFFGRRHLVRQLVGRVATRPLTLIVGPSGCGKSSILNAGLVPALRSGDDRWLVVTFVPGEDPFASLASAAPDLVDPISVSTGRHWPDRPSGADLGCLADQVAPDQRLLLAIDQFEELFVVTPEDRRRAFIRWLVETADDPLDRVRVAATVRADFLDGPLDDDVLGPHVEESVLLVPPLTPSQLQDACVGPARKVGVDVAPELVTRLAADIAHEPGALPLFQYTLTTLFDTRAGGPLTLAGYERLGGLSGALVRQADGVLDRLDDDGVAAARQALVRMVTVEGGAQDTRRRVALAELDDLPVPDDAMRSALHLLGAARLVTFDHDDATNGPTVEVTHEALLRAWPVLRRWIDDARADLRAHRTLATAARQWHDSGRSDDFLLRGDQLATFQAWADRGTVAPTGLESTFLETSRSFAEDTRAREAARRVRERTLEQRSSQRRRQLVALLVVAVVLVGSIGALALDRGRDTARTEVAQQARAVAAAAGAVADEDGDLALLLALEAVRLASEAGGPGDPAVLAALHWGLQASGVPYPDDLPGRVIAGPEGSRRGIFEMELADLVSLATAHVSRPLTAAECDEFLGSDCPPAVTAAVADDLSIEQPPRVDDGGGSGDGPLAGTSVTAVTGGGWNPADPTMAAMLRAVELGSGGVRIDLDVVEPSLAGPEHASWPDGVDLAVFTQASDVVARLGRDREPLDIRTWVPDDRLDPAVHRFVTVDDDGRWPARDGRVIGGVTDVYLEHLVWYSRSEFEEAGYVEPTTYPELVSLTTSMLEDGRTPWCLGLLQAGTDPPDEDHGWSATDLVESLVMADVGPAGYDDWVAGDTTFSDPPVRRAFERYATMVHTPGAVAGGPAAAASRVSLIELLGPFAGGESAGTPDCMLSHGASAAGQEAGADAGWFPFPPITEEGRDTVIGDGVFVVALSDRPEVRAAVSGLLAPSVTSAGIDAGRWAFSASSEFQPRLIPSTSPVRPLAITHHEAIVDDRFRLDASSVMPEPVWQAFNLGMLEVTRAGPEVIGDVVQRIDEARSSAP